MLEWLSCKMNKINNDVIDEVFKIVVNKNNKCRLIY